MAIRPTEPQTIGGVLDTSFQLYRASLGAVWPLCLLLAFCSVIPSIYMVVKGLGLQNPMLALEVMSDPLYWIVYVLSIALTLWAVAAIYAKQGAIGSGESLGLGAALQSTARFILPMVLMSICYGLAVMVGLVLLIIPGLILIVSLVLGTNLIVFEGKGPIAALSGSHRLVWGNWWRTTAIVTVGLFVLIVIYMAAGLVVGIVMPFLSIGAENAALVALIGGAIIGLLINLLVTPFYTALLIAVYWDLKLRKEGSDLAARVGALNPA